MKPHIDNSHHHNESVAIIGHGLAGVMAALMLARKGVRIYLIGKAQQGQGGMQGGMQLASNGLKALRSAGLEEAAVMAQAVRLDRIILKRMGGLVVLAEYVHAEDKPYIAIARHDLMALAAVRLKREKHIQQIESDLIAITQSEGGRPLITLADHRQIEVDEIIGADGQAGYCRQFVTGENFTSETVRAKARPSFFAMRAVVPADHLPRAFSQPHTQLFLGSGYHLVAYPIANRAHVNLVFCAEERLLGDAWQARIFAPKPFFAPLAKPDIIWHKTPLYPAEILPIWRRAHVTLIGDAAHSMPPHLAQGVGQSFADIAALHDCLNEASVPEALRKMTQIRMPQIGAIARKADLSGRAMRLSGIAAKGRDVFLGGAGASFLHYWLADIWHPPHNHKSESL